MSEATVFLWVFTALCVVGAIGIWNNWGREKHNNRRKPHLNQRGFTILEIMIILSLALLMVAVILTVDYKTDQLANKHPVRTIEK